MTQPTPTAPTSIASNNASNDTLADRLRGIAAVVVAILVLAGFIALMFLLLDRVDSAAEGAWSRYVYLFGAAEALVFTAMGWLFGREVNRSAAESATTRADEATARAEEASKLAAGQTAKGEALRSGIETRAAGSGSTARGVEEESIDGGGQVASGGLQDLAALARALFP